MAVARKTASEKIQALLDRGVALPPMPTIGAELLSLIRRPPENVDIRKVANLVQHDPVLTSGLLRIANSPVYGVMRKVTNVNHAIVIIGLEETTSYLNFALVENLVPKCKPLPHFSPEGFWTHSWAVAHTARMLVRPENAFRFLPGEVYLAGLLHDIGKMVFAVHMPDEFQNCLLRAHHEGWPLWRAEEELMSVTHAELGSHLLDRWNLPTQILDAVAFHHQPNEAPGPQREIAAIVQLANLLVKRCAVGNAASPGDDNPFDAWLIQQGHPAFSSIQAMEELLHRVAENGRRRMRMLNPDAEPEEEKPKEAPVRDEPTPPSMTQVPAAAGAGSDSRGLWGKVRGLLNQILE